MVDRRAQLLSATAHLEAPLGIVDDDALAANADDLVRRAGGVPIRVATKSVRVRSVVEEVLHRPGFAGVMTYSLPFGPIGRAMNKLAGRKMGSMWAGMMAGYKQRAESGTEVGQDSPLQLAAVEVAYG